MQLSIVVPCYDEEENVRPFFDETCKCLEGILDCLEFVFIDDGSRDKTASELKKIGEEGRAHVRMLSFSRNFGKEAGLLAGLRAATGDYVAIIDADLQQHPRYIAEMLGILHEHPEYDCVAAYQSQRREGKVLSFFKGAFYKLINHITDIEFYRSASDFRLLSRKMVDAIIALPERCRFSKGIFSWVGFKTYFMPYEVENRKLGKSKWNFWSLASYALDGITSFSDKPLILSSVLGVILFLISILMMLFVVIKTLLFGDPVAGFPTLCSLILLLSGIQLLCIGIVGQYLAKMYEEIKDRPLYIIKEEYDNRK
ncbi:MAG: glycosyltransferase family 2 protein [Clostridia bacterium]|nr:glycosyltransferase family 2 protein [Clostridia bacterium]